MIQPLVKSILLTNKLSWICQQIEQTAFFVPQERNEKAEEDKKGHA